MKRAAFKPRGAPPARPCKVWEGSALPGPRVPALRVEDGKARACVPINKGPKAKPGKRTPTKVEAEWMNRIVEHGCVVCRIDIGVPVPAEVHHILRGGRRMGHLYTLPLCPGHHRDGAGLPGLIARHPFKRRFEEEHGMELDLLAHLKTALGYFDDWKTA